MLYVCVHIDVNHSRYIYIYLADRSHTSEPSSSHTFLSFNYFVPLGVLTRATHP